jgi:hypothetical protein
VTKTTFSLLKRRHLLTVAVILVLLPPSVAVASNASAPQLLVPRITQQPTSAVLPVGRVATFTAHARSTTHENVQWYVALAGASSFTPIKGALRPTYRTRVVPRVLGASFLARFTNHVGSATTHRAVLTGAQATQNWAGYELSGETFTAASATWVVPTANCAGTQTTYADQWVGIDGVASPTIEQLGTQSNCNDGVATYDAWYELSGNATLDAGGEVPDSGTVAAGDTVHAAVAAVAGSWTLVLTDVTQGWTAPFTIDNPVPTPLQTSAEFIIEDPTLSLTNTRDPLTDFGAITMTNASVSSTTSAGSLGSFPRSVITMTNGVNPLATTGALSRGGHDFTVTWVAGS